MAELQQFSTSVDKANFEPLQAFVKAMGGWKGVLLDGIKRVAESQLDGEHSEKAQAVISVLEREALKTPQAKAAEKARIKELKAQRKAEMAAEIAERRKAFDAETKRRKAEMDAEIARIAKAEAETQGAQSGESEGAESDDASESEPAKEPVATRRR